MQPWQLIKTYRTLFLLVLLIVLRLPSLNRPVSKHNEFNTAVVLINAQSWQQAGGPQQFSYTPLLNYQGASNRVFEKGNHIDAKGNHVYLSFGPGWYVIPWFVFNGFNVSFNPLNLRLLSIIIGLLTVLLLQQLILQVTANKDVAFAGAAVFALLPAPLWYCGIGYVTTAIMLPFIIAVLMLWHRFEQSDKNVSFFRLVALFVLSIGLGYCDWISVFLFGIMMIWALCRSFKSPRYLWLVICSGAAVIFPVLLVLWQFAGYLGWQQVIDYWAARFSERSGGVEGGSVAHMLGALATGVFSGFLPLAILLFVYLKNRQKVLRKPVVQWPAWCLAAVVFYNSVFFNWSCIHQFAWMAFGLFATLYFAIYLLPFLPAKKANRLVAATGLISIVMYFIINPPGAKSFSGERYDKQQRAAAWISHHVDKHLPIFMYGETDKVIEYYSGRTFTVVSSLQAAQDAAATYHLKQAVYLQIEKGKILRAIFLMQKEPA